MRYTWMLLLISYTNLRQTECGDLENHFMGSSNPQEPSLEDALSQ